MHSNDTINTEELSVFALAYCCVDIATMTFGAWNVVLCLCVLRCLLLSGAVSEFTPARHEATISSQCGQSDSMQDNDQLREKLKKIYEKLPAPRQSSPACSDFLCNNSNAPSGYYQIQAANGSAIEVFCDMEGIHCGREGGWMRVAHLNMTDPSSQCSVGFAAITANEKRFCIRNFAHGGCAAITLQVFGIRYTQVCGYVRGYAFGTQDAFDSYSNLRSPNETLSGNYVDGVSITYGSPPTHLWTYVAGLNAITTGKFTASECPCNTNNTNSSPPSYVGSDYYCESGIHAMNYQYIDLSTYVLLWHTGDPLWDGMQCGGDEGLCCNHTGMPWFIRNTSSPTTANINLHFCQDEHAVNENIGIERLELYVK